MTQKYMEFMSWEHVYSSAIAFVLYGVVDSALCDCPCLEDAMVDEEKAGVQISAENNSIIQISREDAVVLLA